MKNFSRGATDNWGSKIQRFMSPTPSSRTNFLSVFASSKTVNNLKSVRAAQELEEETMSSKSVSVSHYIIVLPVCPAPIEAHCHFDLFARR